MAPPAQADDSYRTLLEINNAIVSSLTQEALLRAIGLALQPVLPFDRALLTLYDPAKDVRRILAVEGRSRSEASFIGAEFVREPSHAWSAFDEARPIIRHHLDESVASPMEQRLFREGLRSLIAVPLLARGNAIMAFDNLDALRAAYRSPVGVELRADEERLIAQPRVILIDGEEILP